MEKQGRPFVAVVSLDDLDAIERLRRDRPADQFSGLAAQSAREAVLPEPTDDEIVAEVRRTREALYRERYGAG